MLRPSEQVRGLTLVELLVALTLLSTVLWAAAGWVVALGRALPPAESQAEAARSLESLRVLLAEASSVVAPQENSDDRASGSRRGQGREERPSPSVQSWERIGSHRVTVRGRGRRGQDLVHLMAYDPGRRRLVWETAATAGRGEGEAVTREDLGLEGVSDFNLEHEPESEWWAASFELPSGRVSLGWRGR